jgi:hypothetical protein
MPQSLRFALTVLVPAIIGAACSPAEQLYGVSVTRQMLVTVDPDDAHVTDVGSLGTYIQNVTYNSSDGYLYGYDFQTDQRLRRINPADGASVAIGPPITDYGWDHIHGMAYVPDQDVFYATTGYTHELLRIDPDSCVPSAVGAMPAGVWAIAYDSAARVLYGVTTPIPDLPAPYELVRINMSDASLQSVAPLAYVEGLTCNLSTGDLLAARISLPSTATDLIRVDPLGGAITPIGPIGPDDWISGLAYVPEPSALTISLVLLGATGAGRIAGVGRRARYC